MGYQVGDTITTKFGTGVVERVVDGQGYAVKLTDRNITVAIYYKDVIDEKISNG